MVLDKLGSSLKDTFKKLAGMSLVDKESAERIILDIQRALLQSDVDVRLVSDLTKSLKDKILNKRLPHGLTLKEHFIKTLYDELVNFLGKEKGDLEVKKQKILLMGLFGSGKTTTAGKLGKWFKTRGLSVGLVACDIHRPAAQEQLSQISKQIDAKIYTEGSGLLGKKKAEKIAEEALKKSKDDVLIFDSAGRDALDKELAQELKDLSNTIKPDEVLLVIPADIGQAARRQAEEFVKLVGITGIIVSKLDGTAKGGGALTACSVSGAKIKFIGVGEKIGDLEQYDPQRFVSRLIGYGDIQGLLEKAAEVGVDEESLEKIKEGQFTLDEFVVQIKQMQKMGPLGKITEMIPGFSGMKIPKDTLDVQEGKMKKWEHIIKSMTKEERQDPEIIKQSRITRIAKGSGTRPEDVKELMKSYKQIKKVMKMMGGGKGLKRGAFAGLAKQFGMKL